MTITKAIQEEFVAKYGGYAYEAGKKYNVNPLVILAQAAVESAWGTSVNVAKAFNFFGIVAAGSENEYWKGYYRIAGTGLKFRIYKKPADSFFDFARLISTSYKSAAALSFSVKDYAKAIAYSRYISESNGDNRPNYMKGIITAAVIVQAYLTTNNVFGKWKASDIIVGIGAGFIIGAGIYLIRNNKQQSLPNAA